MPYLEKLIKDFLNKKITLKEFREKSGDYPIKYPYWGFKDASEQMQLNQYYKNIKDTDWIEWVKNDLQKK